MARKDSIGKVACSLDDCDFLELQLNGDQVWLHSRDSGNTTAIVLNTKKAVQLIKLLHQAIDRMS